jgi:DNA-binding MarR family transcriptional regulator
MPVTQPKVVKKVVSSKMLAKPVAAKKVASKKAASPATSLTKVSAPLVPMLPAFKLEDEPGHLLRRAQQIAVAKFHEVHGRHVTPIQYAILRTLAQNPGIDQVTLAQLIALDTSTTADTATRLETKGWVHREVLPRRQRSLSLTEQGQAILAELTPGAERMQDALMCHFKPDEQQTFLRLLRTFVNQR